jgi:hypothetical protein
MTDVLVKKNAKFFRCENCDFECSKKSNFDKHLLTPKHTNTDKILTNTDAKNAENAENALLVSNMFICGCGNTYKHRQSLFNHKKKCDTTTITDSNVDSFDKDQLILMLIKQNADLIKDTSEFKNMMMEVIKNGTHNTINTNSHNKSFNLNVFLNETCKDAMNIMDFVNSLKIELSDLENVGSVGYVSGISSIIVKNLNLLDETKRPVHCADTKREVMYVKDNNKWEKDTENKSQMRKIIKHATHKNSKLLKEYKDKYPGCEKSESKYSYAYDKLIVETFGGKGDNEVEKENKIIRNIAKNVTISKDNF